ncbi:Serine/threonine-protein kinase RIM11/MSD1 [Nakaseomyces glabratus]|uniref:Serine/threonine-protein kinase RIM11/MSD1 n=1 Tax=Candida glabrata TaxID=5478 RepID=A0A0W0CGK9_CANGB|nr:Serine/threonine-protein kinase RIM11/MSD1 [Nakaseomyces glabratus]
MNIEKLTGPEIVKKQVYYGHEVVNGAAKSSEPITISFPATEVVGHGSFGVVFTTVIQETNEKVAIKKVLQDKRFKNRELEIMKMLQHRNIIDLKYYFYEIDEREDVFLNLILDYMPQSLYQRLRHFVHQRTPMPRLEIKIYMYQLFKALNYLHHTANVCHRDIKPQNLLYDPTQRYHSLQCLCTPYFDEIRFGDGKIREIIKDLKLLEFDEQMELAHLGPDERGAVKQKLHIQ